MLTPIDIQNHTLKTAVRGYSKKETDEFLEQILAGYEELFKENHDLKEKVSSLSESVQNYKQMETTLQKALVLAEKTSAETQEAAKSKADAMIREAQTKAESIEKEATSQAESLRKETEAYAEITKAKANNELSETRNHVRKLVQSYESYRLQFKKLAESQIEMLESENYSIYAPEIDEMLNDTKADNTDADTAAAALPEETDSNITESAITKDDAVSEEKENAQETIVSKDHETKADTDTENEIVTANTDSLQEDTNETEVHDTDALADAQEDNPAQEEEKDIAKEQEDTQSDSRLSEDDIDAISQKLASGFDKMTQPSGANDEDSQAHATDAKASEDILTTPKLDDFTGDDTIHSVDPEEDTKDSPFTFIEP